MKRGKKSGFILVSVYLIIIVLIILTIGFSSRSIQEANLSLRQKSSLQALYLAEAGVDSALEWLRGYTAPPVPYNSGVVSLGAGNFNFTVTSIGALSYEVLCVGTVGGVTRALSTTFTQDHYARYAYFTNSELYQGGSVWFVDWDVLRGPVHTNSRFNMKGNPTFEDYVKSVSDVIRFYNNGSPIDTSSSSNPPYDAPDFQYGLVLGADDVPMPARALDLRNAAASSGLYLNGSSTVTFNSNGTINVTNAARGWNNFNTNIPANGAIFVNGAASVSGTVNGSATIGSSSNITVTDNILYSDDPRTNPNSTDKLGIIAEAHVIIPQTAPNNLEIDASIMALNTSFTLQNFSQGPPKGTLTVYGGIIQKNRGPVGTFSGMTKLSGYSKNYQYDTRLLTSPPPFNPTTGDYVMLTWKEE
ncbi:MAG: DUF4900 domain-containing protein [Candidatus Omnitrophota bacterium]|nr:DUF4900 domain-containing protein [Candidatus Omnitrophota bacterium]